MDIWSIVNIKLFIIETITMVNTDNNLKYKQWRMVQYCIF